MSAIPHETTLLPASAGTGKTFRIVDLLRDLVLDEGQDLRRVVVVTFTEAAAGELRDRIRERFVQAREGLLRLLAGETWKEPDESIGTWVKARVADRTAEEKAERAWQTLVAFDTCCITTIHGFCARVLTEAAFEAGAPFATEMLGSTDPLFEAVVDDFWLRHTHDAPVATLTSFHALGITRKVMRDVAKKAADPSLIIAPDDPGTPEPVDLGPWFDLLRAAHRAVEDHGDTLVGTVAKSPTIHSRRDSAKGITAAITANRMGKHLEALPGWLETDPVPGKALPEHVSELTYDFLRLCTVQGQTTPSHPLCDALQALADEKRKLEPQLRDWKLSLKHEIVRASRARVDALLRQRNALTFDSLLRHVQEPLLDQRLDRLRNAVRRRYDAAMVDEFQDTDPCQWDIFRLLFGDRLFLVGDPKQAIYRFRGADFSTYRRAESACTRLPSLAHNHRTDDDLVKAVNHLFAREIMKAPMFDPDIEYPEVESAKPASRMVGDSRPPLHVRLLSRVGRKLWQYRWIEKYDRETRLPKMVANDVVRELKRNGRIQTKDGERPIGPGDCAVLTRSNDQAREVARALIARGVPATVRSDASVLDSAEQGDLVHVLRAVNEPLRTDLVRRALLTDLMGTTAAELVSMQGQDARWVEVSGRFRRWRSLWEEHGILAVVRALLDEGGVSQRLLSQGRERSLTNLRHLGELLQRVEIERRASQSALLTWLEAGGPGLDPEDASLRVETDAAAVQCATVHSAKGLQYPLVWAPWLFGGSWLSGLDEENLVVDDPDHPGCRRLDLGSPQHAALLDRRREDGFAEDLRLIYVALTRAEHRCVLYHGAGGERAALAWLIDQRGFMGSREDRWSREVWDRLKWFKDNPREDRLESDLTALAKHSGIDWDLADWKDSEHRERWEPSAPDTRPLAAGTLDRPTPPDTWWRRTSFTGLTRAVSPLDPRPEVDHDSDEEVPEPVVPGSDPVPLTDIPGSARFGNLVHAALEHHDFRAGAAGLKPLVATGLVANNLPAAWEPSVTDAIADALHAPLLPDGFALAHLAPEDRWAELDFHLPLLGGLDGGADLLTTRRLAKAFDGPLGPGLDDRWREHVRRLAFVPARGFLTGSIDLVFRHEGRWYLADYKTNRLGPDWADYAPDALVEPMMHALYPLQYHLYAVALVRLLRARIPGFDVQRDFGGVAYLFLRGMSPARPGHGVFFDRPPPALLQALDDALGGAA